MLYEKLPLAELSGEIAGGLFNPEGLKEYLRAKKMKEQLESGGTPMVSDSKGGMAYSTTKLDSKGNIVDEEGNIIMSVEELEKFLNSL